MKKIQNAVVVGGFFVGLLSSFLGVVYLVGMLGYAFDESAHLSAVAYIPKWLFAFAPLILLGRTKAVKRVADALGYWLDPQQVEEREARRKAALPWWER